MKEIILFLKHTGMSLLFGE